MRHTKTTIALAMSLMAVAAGTGGCKFFRKKNNASVLKTDASPFLKGDLNVASGLSLNGLLSDTREFRFVINVKDDTLKNTKIANFNPSFSSDDFSFFEKMNPKPSVNAKLLRTRGGSTTEIFNGKLQANDYSIAGVGNILVENGDTFEIVISEIPEAFKGLSAALYAYIYSESAWEPTDSMATDYGSWDGYEAEMATAPEKKYEAETSSKQPGVLRAVLKMSRSLRHCRFLAASFTSM
jgi:hypothetical protein